MTILSPAAREQLGQPRAIGYSVPKMAVGTALLAAFFLLFLWAGWKLFFVISKTDPDRIGYWFALVAGGVFGLMVLRTVLPAWRGLGKPVVSISKEGLTFSGKPLIPWAMIKENSWHKTYAGGFITVSSSIRIRGTDGQIPMLGKWNYTSFGGGFYDFDSFLLACSSKEYLQVCELYSAAGGQGGAPS